MKDIKKSILTIVIVFITLGIVGAETWLIYSQILGPIIPVIGAVFITSCLTLFIYKLISNARPKSNEELLDINTYKTFDSTEISNFDVPNLEESDNLKKQRQKRHYYLSHFAASQIDARKFPSIYYFVLIHKN